MAKSIKHIRAGLLHIEVIGNVPDQNKLPKQRAARASPTSPAQQFYNLKSSWRELELMGAENFGAQDVVLVFTFDNAHLPRDKKDAGVQFQKFIRKLRTVRKKRGQELKYIFVVEGFHAKRADDVFGEDGDLEDKRLHIHAIFNRVGAGDLDEFKSLWPYGGYIRAEPLDVHYYRELAKYMTKEAREFGRPKPGDRTWRASRNLRKYSVEYIDIPTDSVTLSPPNGAVDYTQFGERNPYGYGECIGARYLLFPKAERKRYSYNQKE